MVSVSKERTESLQAFLCMVGLLLSLIFANIAAAHI